MFSASINSVASPDVNAFTLCVKIFLNQRITTVLIRLFKVLWIATTIVGLLAVWIFIQNTDPFTFSVLIAVLTWMFLLLILHYIVLGSSKPTDDADL